MKFDLILTNPPFQDYENRGKTRHKLWIDFTKAVFDRLLEDDGVLCQVSPSSFQSASSPVLTLMKTHVTPWIRFDTGEHFPDVGSTFADYLVRKRPHDGSPTAVRKDGRDFSILLGDEVFYLPNDLCGEAMGIHRKVVFEAAPTLAVERDYVTCHNVLLRRRPSVLSKERTEQHVHPVFHTNGQTWWASVRQPFAGELKVMWSRSGYTRPFFDAGELGGTDMAYYVRVGSAQEGHNLAHNLRSRVLRYVFATARWSGFGNERVFAHLPDLPRDRALTDEELYARFSLTDAEVAHVERAVG